MSNGRAMKALRLILLMCLLSGPAVALDLVNIVLAPLPPLMIEAAGTDQRTGMIGEILIEAFRRDGKAAKFAFMPGPRAELTVRNGRALATVTSTDRGEREDYFLFSNPLIETTVSAFVGTGYSGPPLDSFAAIADRQQKGETRMRVVSIYGDPVINGLRAAGVEVEEVPGIESAFTLVLRAGGRVVLVTYTDPVLHVAQQTGTPPAAFSRFTVEPCSFYLAIARSRPGAAGLIDRFNNALSSLREDGAFDTIRARYTTIQAAAR
jgi:ABC-type amino acid transport substrate-binding protein